MIVQTCCHLGTNRFQSPKRNTWEVIDIELLKIEKGIEACPVTLGTGYSCKRQSYQGLKQNNVLVLWMSCWQWCWIVSCLYTCLIAGRLPQDGQVGWVLSDSQHRSIVAAESMIAYYNAFVFCFSCDTWKATTDNSPAYPKMVDSKLQTPQISRQTLRQNPV